LRIVEAENFAALADGTVVRNPRWPEPSAAELVAEQRGLAGKKRGDRNRRKARPAFEMAAGELQPDAGKAGKRAIPVGSQLTTEI
jgi:hypothetical protein